MPEGIDVTNKLFHIRKNQRNLFTESHFTLLTPKQLLGENKGHMTLNSGKSLRNKSLEKSPKKASMNSKLVPNFKICRLSFPYSAPKLKNWILKHGGVKDRVHFRLESVRSSTNSDTRSSKNPLPFLWLKLSLVLSPNQVVLGKTIYGYECKRVPKLKGWVSW